MSRNCSKHAHRNSCGQKARALHDGRTDGLTPLESLDLSRVDSFAGLLRAMSRTAFSGRQLGEAFDVMLDMAGDADCRTALTVSGAMTVAKQGQIICDLIDRGLVDAVVATGALITHGLTESIGMTHYQHDESLSDQALFAKGYNRIYDTLEMESNLNHVEELVASILSSNEPDDGVWTSSRLCRAIGERLSELDQGPGILRSAFEQNVPVFIPAFTDSEMGLDVSIWAMREQLESNDSDRSASMVDEAFQAAPTFNPFLDLQAYARLMTQSHYWGILTIGGGVPRNWAQQVGPYIDAANNRLGLNIELPRFRYGVRICPEPVHWGGLSGCTYSEGVSWGKFVPPDDGGRFAEVYTDATVALPLLTMALFEELDRRTSAKRTTTKTHRAASQANGAR